VTESDRYDRLRQTGGDGPNGDEPTRESVLTFWTERFGVDPETFEGHTFWEKGAGSVWAVAGDAPEPIKIEALGVRLLRTRGDHWKPTTDGAQRFAGGATRNVIELDREQARSFVAGTDQAIDWAGDWGFLLATTPLGGKLTVLGIGLYTYGELASNVPKARRIDFDEQ